LQPLALVAFVGGQQTGSGELENNCRAFFAPILAEQKGKMSQLMEKFAPSTPEA